MKLNLGGKSTGPLAGIRVIDLSTIVSGPLCAQILGDLGADVVKVETPGGETARILGGVRKAGMTGFFAQFNRNKRGPALDLKREPAQAALRALAKRADVVVENFRPGVMERLGLGCEALRAENPRLIYVAISGFGPDGPDAGQPAYDMVIQARAGFAKLLGSAAEPKLIRNLVADKTSALTAAWATLAALFARERCGVGQRVDVPMLDAFASFVLPDAFGPYVFGDPPESAALGEKLYRAWQTADGHVAVVIIEDRQFQALCRVLGREDLAGDARYTTLFARLQNAAGLFELMESELRKHSTADLVARARLHEAPLAAINDIPAFLADAQVQASGTIVTIPHPVAGDIATFASAPRFSATASDVRLPPPMLGEHSQEVLREAGLSDAEIAAALG